MAVKKYNFIRTTDNDTKQILLNSGFNLVSDDGNIATFINNTNSNIIKFENIDESKIQYSNMLSI